MSQAALFLGIALPLCGQHVPSVEGCVTAVRAFVLVAKCETLNI